MEQRKARNQGIHKGTDCAVSDRKDAEEQKKQKRKST